MRHDKPQNPAQNEAGLTISQPWKSTEEHARWEGALRRNRQNGQMPPGYGKQSAECRWSGRDEFQPRHCHAPALRWHSHRCLERILHAATHETGDRPPPRTSPARLQAPDRPPRRATVCPDSLRWLALIALAETLSTQQQMASQFNDHHSPRSNKLPLRVSFVLSLGF